MASCLLPPDPYKVKFLQDNQGFHPVTCMSKSVNRKSSVRYSLVSYTLPTGTIISRWSTSTIKSTRRKQMVDQLWTEIKTQKTAGWSSMDWWKLECRISSTQHSHKDVCMYTEIINLHKLQALMLTYMYITETRIKTHPQTHPHTPTHR